LDTLTSDQYVSDSSQTTSLSTSLYTINPEIADVIQSSDITQEYLQGNKELLGRYQTALNNGNAQSLNMDVSDYQQSRDYVDELVELTTKSLDKRILLAQEYR
jgi:hypothetical protein